jgi:hypothetical protein
MTLIRKLLVSALTLLTATAATAQSKPPSAAPTPAPRPGVQMPTNMPTARDAISRWLAICIENAGNPGAQRRAGQRAGIAMPYMLQVEEGSEIGDTCGIVTIAVPGTTMQDTLALLRTELGRRGTIELFPEGGYFGGNLSLNRRQFRVIGIVQQNDSGTGMTFAVILSTGEGNR